jgi:hypothetical protein
MQRAHRAINSRWLSIRGSRVRLHDKGERHASNPTFDERKTFKESFEGMTQGWSGTFEQLSDYLAKA